MNRWVKQSITFGVMLFEMASWGALGHVVARGLGYTSGSSSNIMFTAAFTLIGLLVFIFVSNIFRKLGVW